MTFSRYIVSALGLILAIGFSSIASAQNYSTDLTLTNLSITSQSSAYTDFSITAQNQGESKSPKSWIGIYTGNTFRRACPVIALFPKQQTTITCRFYNNTNADRTANLRFFIDDMEEIQEINESNNTAFVNQQTQKIQLPSTQIPAVQTPVVRQPMYTTPIVNSGIYTPVPSPTPVVAQEPLTFYNGTSFGENIGQYITCHFQEGGNGKKKCTLVAGNATSQTLFCTDDLCRLKIYGSTGSKVSFQGSCGGTQSTTLDGYNKNLFYSCPITINNQGTIPSTISDTPTPLLPIEQNRFLNISQGEETQSSLSFGDKYTLSYNDAIKYDDTLEVNKGDIFTLAIAFEDIDENLENYVYKRIPKNLRIVEVDFPESVECRTRTYSSFSTVFCRGQDSFTEIIYTLQAVTAGKSEIYGKIRYTDNEDKILDTGYIPVLVK